MEKFFELEELNMAREMKHLHLFPTEFPKDQGVIILNKIRGIPDNKSKRDVVEAAWWCGGYALNMIPDDHPVQGVKPDAVGMKDGELTLHLDSLCGEGVHGLIPWDRIAEKLFDLFKAWLAEWLAGQ